MIKCINCNNLTTNNKFCSRSCAASHNNKLYPKRLLENTCKKCQCLIISGRTYCNNCWEIIRHLPKLPSKQNKFCLYCGKRVKNKFCNNNTCFQQYIFLERIKQVEDSGYVYLPDKFNTTASFAKRYLIYKNGNKCSICDILPYWNNKPLTLILDHVNGVPNDWHISNLRLICSNCDSQLPTYKNKNKGNGRPR